MTVVLLVSAGLVVAVVLLTRAPAENLIKNPSFDKNADGWKHAVKNLDGVTFDWLEDGGRSGTGGIHIRNDQGNRPWFWSYDLADTPQANSLRVSGWAKAKNASTLVAICVQGWDDEYKKLVAFSSTQYTKPVRGDFEWTRLETYFTPSSETRHVCVLLMIVGSGAVWFDDVATVDIGRTEVPARSGQLDVPGQVRPGLFEVRGECKVTATAHCNHPTLLIPLPILYREHVPLTYEVSAEPAKKLVRARIYGSPPDNYIADVELAAFAPGDTVSLQWSSIVLCAARSFDNMPTEAPLPEDWPAEVRPWLRSTRCVQAQHKRIQLVAREIRGESRDVLEIIQKTLQRTKAIYLAQQGDCKELDAVHALDKRGSCTSCANLVAALLRASDIPARVLAGYPTDGEPLETHYIVEAYVPGYGWYPIESTCLQAPWQPYLQIEVAIIPPEHEDRSEARYPNAGGVPYLSIMELPGYDGSYSVLPNLDGRGHGHHVAKVWRAFPSQAPAADWEHAIELGRARWMEWLESSPSLDARHQLATPLRPEALEADNPAKLAERLKE